MDIATLVGIVVAFGLVFGTIAMGGNIGAFIAPDALLIVLGGTIGAVLINYPLGSVLGTFGVAKNAFLVKTSSALDVIKTLVDFASKARREGLLALENELNDSLDPFLAEGIRLAVDGQEAAVIESVMVQSIESLRERHKLGAEVFTTFATYAPALGLVGTLIGLIMMLQNMDDPSSIGPSMAVALLTTLYGAIFANLIFSPIAGKLRTRSSSEVQNRELIMAGVLAISAGDNPRVVEQKLLAHLSPKDRTQAAEQAS